MSAVRQCPKCSRRRCFICGSKKDLQEHHLGGRNHARFSTITLCRIHHEPVSILIARAKISPDFTSDMVERARRARQTALVFQWFLDDAIAPESRSNKHDDAAKSGAQLIEGAVGTK